MKSREIGVAGRDRAARARANRPGQTPGLAAYDQLDRQRQRQHEEGDVRQDAEQSQHSGQQLPASELICTDNISLDPAHRRAGQQRDAREQRDLGAGEYATQPVGRQPQPRFHVIVNTEAHARACRAMSIYERASLGTVVALLPVHPPGNGRPCQR